MKDLDLTKMDEFGGCEPCGVSKPKPQGPTIHLEWEEPYDLPDEGTATVSFKIQRSSEDKKNGTYSVTLELTALKDIKEKGKKDVIKPKDAEAGDALDALRKEAMEKY